MRETIFRSGYVGLVTGACLADAGNYVVCVDVGAAKIARNREKGRLAFTTDAKPGVALGLFQVIAVGTLPDEDGSADQRMIVMDPRSAEVAKCAANAMLATKVSFMNEMANIAERLGADIEMVRTGIGSDPRIGYSFNYPGAGYGGSCFPKDVKALKRSPSDIGHDAQVLAAVESVNDRQKKILFDKHSRFFGGELGGRTIAIWRLAFKPNTDDLREAPSRVLMGGAVASGRPRARLRPGRHNRKRSAFTGRERISSCAPRVRPLSKVRTHWLHGMAGIRQPGLCCFQILAQAARDRRRSQPV